MMTAVGNGGEGGGIFPFARGLIRSAIFCCYSSSFINDRPPARFASTTAQNCCKPQEACSVLRQGNEQSGGGLHGQHRTVNITLSALLAGGTFESAF